MCGGIHPSSSPRCSIARATLESANLVANFVEKESDAQTWILIGELQKGAGKNGDARSSYFLMGDESLDGAPKEFFGFPKLIELSVEDSHRG